MEYQLDGIELTFIHMNHPYQDNWDVSRRVYAPDVLVQRLNGSVATVVCNGENQHIPVCPVDGPEKKREDSKENKLENICFMLKPTMTW